jgi:hypothetical protein
MLPLVRSLGVLHTGYMQNYFIRSASVAVRLGTRLFVVLAALMIILAMGLIGPATTAGASSPSWADGFLVNQNGWSGAELQGLSCLSATTCVAAGSYSLAGSVLPQLPLIATMINSQWIEEPLPLPSGMTAKSAIDLDAVSCSSSSFCVAVGSSQIPSTQQRPAAVGFAEVFNGATWTPTTNFGDGVSPSTFASVSCTQDDMCVAVGSTATDQGVIASLTDGSWATMLPPTTTAAPKDVTSLTGVSCATATFCIAIGDGLSTDQLNGSDWITGTLPNINGAPSGAVQLKDISCPSTTSCVAGGDYYTGVDANPTSLFPSPERQGLTETLAGTSWYPSAPPFVDDFTSMSCSEIESCVGIDINGPVQEVNGVWTDVSLTPSRASGALGSTYFLAVSCTAPRCVAVGQASLGINTSALVSSSIDPAVVGIVSTADGHGYWLANQNGGVFSYGSASFEGSLGDSRLNNPVVGASSTPDGKGYWLVASDGGIFSFGDASFFGSTGALRLNKPIVGMAATPDGKGYWLVASDGGIFSFGTAQFQGSAGAVSLNQPIVGMAATPDGKGYWLAASDGGIFTYGDAPFEGAS